MARRRSVRFIALVALAALSLLAATATPAPAAKKVCAWRVVATPNPGTITRQLDAVYAIGAKDVWAVGSYDYGYPLAIHWDGKKWKRFAVPNPPGRYAQLRGVWGSAKNDVWAVGRNFLAGDVDHSFVVHWNGSAWSIVPAPAGSFSALLSAVGGTSKTNAWAVGYQNGQTSDGTRNLALHWDGMNWTEAAVPNYSTGFRTLDMLEGVYARTATNAWTVGSFAAYDPMSTNLLPWHATFNHFTGTWSASAEKNFGVLSNKVHAVDGARGTVWAVGEYQTASTWKPLFLRLDGTPKIAPAPPGLKKTELADVFAASASRAWAVGNVVAPPAPNGRKSIALHWTGGKWTRVTTKNPGKLQTFLAGVDGVSDTDAWAVGRSTGASAFKSLAERYSCK